MNKRIFAVMGIALIFTILTACSLNPKLSPASNQSGSVDPQTQDTVSSETGNNEKKVVMNLYFANEDNSAVPVEKREVEVKDGAVVKAAILALLEGPSNKGLRRTIPEGTRLLDVNLKDNVAVVNFSEEFTKVNDIAEIVERASLVNTLTEIKGVERVKILIEGKDLIGPSGMPFGELKRFNLDEQGRPVSEAKKTVTLYFANSQADAVAAEKRDIYISQGEPLEAAVMRELMRGPEATGLYGVIPEGTRLLSVTTEDGLCKLDLSREFVDNSNGGSAGEEMTIYSIVNTLTELQGINKVQFLVDGKIREAYIHAELDEPFSRYEDIIQK